MLAHLGVVVKHRISLVELHEAATNIDESISVKVGDKEGD